MLGWQSYGGEGVSLLPVGSTTCHVQVLSCHGQVTEFAALYERNKNAVMLFIQKYAKYDILPGLHLTTIQFNVSAKILQTLTVNYNVVRQTNQNFLTGLTSLFIRSSPWETNTCTAHACFLLFWNMTFENGLNSLPASQLLVQVLCSQSCSIHFSLQNCHVPTKSFIFFFVNSHFWL